MCLFRSPRSGVLWRRLVVRQSPCLPRRVKRDPVHAWCRCKAAMVKHHASRAVVGDCKHRVLCAVAYGNSAVLFARQHQCCPLSGSCPAAARSLQSACAEATVIEMYHSPFSFSYLRRFGLQCARLLVRRTYCPEQCTECVKHFWAKLKLLGMFILY